MNGATLLTTPRASEPPRIKSPTHEGPYRRHSSPQSGGVSRFAVAAERRVARAHGEVRRGGGDVIETIEIDHNGKARAARYTEARCRPWKKFAQKRCASRAGNACGSRRSCTPAS